MRKDEQQGRRILAVDDGERPDTADTCSIHRRDEGVTHEARERALLRPGKQVVPAQLYELAGRGLRECGEMGRRQHARSCSGGEKLTSVHVYLVAEGS